MKNHDKAIEAYNEAIRLSPDFSKQLFLTCKI
ncbi:MAG: tetratricopeptide repeat protein [Bacteroidetes bacterium]|nr:tetratricopeptide repeat protein [Bacteroidota bacterium]